VAIIERDNEADEDEEESTESEQEVSSNEESDSDSEVGSESETEEDKNEDEDEDEDEAEPVMRVSQQRRTAERAGARQSNAWDVTGHWRVAEFSRGIVKGDTHDLSLHAVDIPTSQYGSAGTKRRREEPTVELWAKFCFSNDIDGYMRFLNKGATTTYMSGTSAYDFKLTAADMPQLNNDELHYRWRGRETGENVIELYSDMTPMRVIFSQEGTRIAFKSNSPAMGTYLMKGRKVRELSNKDMYEALSFRSEWQNLN
jgi:hypothetical protein